MNTHWRPAGRPGLYTAGPRDGTPLVLVHGIRLSAWMWAPYAARLAPDFRITACDLPGHGALRTDPFTLEGAVEQIDAAVAEARDATGLSPWVAGSPLGGYATLAYGAARPGRAAGLLVNGATARTTGGVRRVYATADRVLRAMGESRADRLNRWLFRRALPSEVCAAVLRGGLAVRGFGQVVADLAGRDFLAMAGSITTPVVFVNGRRDRLFRSGERDFVEAVRSAGTPVRLAHVPGSHVLCLTDPDTFSRVLVRGHRELGRLTAPPPAPALPSP
ncbi:alpha/beta hydrolase [Streptomyces sp. NBC_00190]|uniref:alpha/beta fold hydrolase n=1 Tax=Streptomyces sp. NBC_00190 TaxID=2903634 RepID=UPI002E2D544D|nr:alpha/beta hydrolase [Streptomyces sp. NBC_00190]